MKNDEYEPPWIHRRATIYVDLYYSTIESDGSIKAAIEQELNCCHCVNEILDIELKQRRTVHHERMEQEDGGK